MREYHEVRFRFSGNEDLARRYILLGRKFLGILKNINQDLGGLPTSLRRTELLDGTVITVRSYYGQDEIAIRAPLLGEELEPCELYLESGRQDLGGLAATAPDANAPAVVTMSSTLATDDEWNGGVALQGKPVPHTVEQRPIDTGDESRVVTGDDITQNLVRVFVPPSVYSGKLRYYVQCLYGSDSELGMDGVPMPYLRVQSYGLNWAFDESSGLYTGEDYTYYIIKVTGSGVYAQELGYTECGEALRSWLLVNEGDLSADDLKAAEGYLLTETTPGAPVPIGDASNAYQHGSPAAYGWKFNWKGDKASVVVMEQLDDGSEAWESRVMTLTITEASGVLSASASVGGVNTFLIYNAEHYLWFPSFATGDHQAQVSHGATPTLFSCDAPVYCWYDSADNLVLVRYTYTVDGSVEVIDTTPVGGCGAWNLSYQDTTVTHSGRGGFYVTGGLPAFSAETKNFTAGTYHTFTMGPSGARSNSGWTVTTNDFNEASNHGCYPGLVDKCVGGTTANNWVREYRQDMQRLWWNNTSGTLSGNSACVIPYSDCEAAYVGIFQQKIFENRLQKHWNNRITQFDIAEHNSSVTHDPLQPGPVSCELDSLLTDQNNWVDVEGTISPLFGASFAVLFAADINASHLDISFCGKDKAVTAYQSDGYSEANYSGTDPVVSPEGDFAYQGGVGTFAWGGWNIYFSAALAIDSNSHSTLRAYQSAQEYAKRFSSLPSGDVVEAGGYPAYPANWTFVGRA